METIELTESQLITVNNTDHLGSTDYRTINTGSIISQFAEHGFKLTEYKETRVQKEEKENKMRHMVRMSLDTINGVRRDVIIFNSHDTSTSLRLNIGSFRAVCMNLCVFGDSLLPEMKIRHTDSNADILIQAYIMMAKKALDEELTIRQNMEAKLLTFSDINEFAREAMVIKEGSTEGILDYSAVSQIQRPEDNSMDLFTVFNRIQEGIVQGNYRKESVKIDEDTGKSIVTYRSVPELKDQAKLIRVNKELHELAMKYL